ncbi:unnamed protein product [Vitrella brassicaformis CCMP3155]|uniref:Serine aminopeptidase S33 domain-containing protein n=2 Tax=Vitrella brassicaformis TaxID=1169539 RepID=A0A0G4EPP1_VITBC|nr:unnamed protein product [Vitrella brassicaformis CCMP3155]|eukprot:CEL99230.1 unnamed protein product [Vitrella brassicaformis CCMP3155]
MTSCDGVVCCLGCLSLVPGLKKKIVSNMAFFPPRPPGYRIDDGAPGGGHPLQRDWDGSVVQVFLRSIMQLPMGGQQGSMQPMPKTIAVGRISVDAVRLRTGEGNYIWGFHFRHHTPKNGQWTLVFSHGNSTDIGMMFQHFSDLAENLGIHVFAYDYSGYGCSTGEPSEHALYADIEAVFRHLVHEQHIPQKSLILYGQSVGSAPTIDLASREEVGGVVIHSGMKSGLSVLRKGMGNAPWFDAFKNVNKIRKVMCPVFVMHGMNDSEVRCEHGEALAEAAMCKFPPWWVFGAGHNDIEVVSRSLYFKKLTEFIQHINKLAHTHSYTYAHSYTHPVHGHGHPHGHPTAATASASRLTVPGDQYQHHQQHAHAYHPPSHPHPHQHPHAQMPVHVNVVLRTPHMATTNTTTSVVGDMATAASSGGFSSLWGSAAGAGGGMMATMATMGIMSASASGTNLSRWAGQQQQQQHDGRASAYHDHYMRLQ